VKRGADDPALLLQLLALVANKRQTKNSLSEVGFVCIETSAVLLMVLFWTAMHASARVCVCYDCALQLVSCLDPDQQASRNTLLARELELTAGCASSLFILYFSASRDLLLSHFD
jgi:hypothetical protein